nr:MAG TPA: hypothetical protein [Caudoviricetes sp.]
MKPKIRFYILRIEKYELRTVIYTHNIEFRVKNYTSLSKYYILNIYYIHYYIIYYEESLEGNVGTYLHLFLRPDFSPSFQPKAPVEFFFNRPVS